MSLKDLFKSCTEIKRVMNSTSCVNVSRQTVSRRLQEIGLFNQTPRKTPLVTSKIRVCKQVCNLDMEIGQKYFSVMTASLIYLEMMEKNNVKRRIGERLSAKWTKKTVKLGGGSVMVFGMFSSQGTTPLVRLQTRVNVQIYKNIVQDHVVPIIQNSGFDRANFM